METTPNVTPKQVVTGRKANRRKIMNDLGKKNTGRQWRKQRKLAARKSA